MGLDRELGEAVGEGGVVENQNRIGHLIIVIAALLGLLIVAAAGAFDNVSRIALGAELAVFVWLCVTLRDQYRQPAS